METMARFVVREATDRQADLLSDQRNCSSAYPVQIAHTNYHTSSYSTHRAVSPHPVCATPGLLRSLVEGFIHAPGDPASAPDSTHTASERYCHAENNGAWLLLSDRGTPQSTEAVPCFGTECLLQSRVSHQKVTVHLSRCIPSLFSLETRRLWRDFTAGFQYCTPVNGTYKQKEKQFFTLVEGNRTRGERSSTASISCEEEFFH